MRKKMEEVELVPPLTFEQLNTLMVLSRWGKQAAAESALGKSQSQISRDLSALEKSLGGLILFDRSARRPTEAGRHVLDYASEVFRNWHRLKEKLAGQVEGIGEVTLVAEEGCVAGAVVPFLAELSQHRPDLRVRLLTRSGISAADTLARGEAEVGILLADGRTKGVSVRPWTKGAVVAAVPSTMAVGRRKTLPLSMFRGTSLLVASEDSPLCEVLHASGGRKEGTVHKFQEIGSGRDAALAAVAGGLGVALLLQFKGMTDPLERQLPAGIVLRPVAGKIAAVRYGVAVRRGWQPSGSALALVKELMRMEHR